MAATRRLAAIMFTDIVGYSAITQTNEAAALKLLREEEDLVRPLLAIHQGREVKSTGDGFLVVFESALRAVQCAIDIHQHLQERNAQPGVTPITLRIGVHLGDVEERGSDVFGDSVNLAARIEPLAEPGGICITEPVFGQVRNKIPNQLEKLEPRVLKNIRFPMEVYRVILPWIIRELPAASAGPTRLAVLPFANISPDPNDAYFAEGLTEELITVLSQLRELRVIARTSVSQYKATTKSVSQIGTELGVDAVLEGSVRKAGDQLRITVQLIDVRTQEHSWANTYDRKLANVFALQTEIAKRVAKQLKVSVKAAEEARLDSRPTVKPDSYLAYLKGRTFLHTLQGASAKSAKEQFELAISLDPQNAAAHSGLADAMRLMTWTGTGASRKEWEEAGRRSASRAIELDPDLAEAHTSLALILWDDREFPAAEREFKLAVSLNPSYSLAHGWYGVLLLDEGRPEEGLLEFRLAEGADPLWTLNLWYMGWTLICLGRLDEALATIQRLGEVDRRSGMYHGVLGRYYLARSDLEGCLRELRRALEVQARPDTHLADQALILALSGEKEQAKALLREIEATPVQSMTGSSIPTWAYCELGDLDGCFRWMEKVMEIATPPFQQIQIDPRLEPVRRDPRFQVLLKKMELA